MKYLLFLLLFPSLAFAQAQEGQKLWVEEPDTPVLSDSTAQDTVGILRQNVGVLVLEAGKNWVQIRFNQIEGYVPLPLLSPYNLRSKRYQEEIEQKRHEQRIEQWKRQNPNISDTIKDLVEMGIVQIGWPQSRCRIALGDPDDTSRTITAELVQERWSYQRDSGWKHYFFENDTLVKIQEN